MGCGSSRIPACCGKNKDELQVDESSALPLPYDTSKDDGGVTEDVAGVLFGGGEARHEKEQPQDKEEPTKETPAAAGEDSTPAAKSGSDSKDKVANEAGSESSSEQSDKDNDKSDGGFAVRIAEKLGLMPTEEKEDETAATAAVDTHAGPTEETPAAAGKVATPAAKSDSDSSDSGSSSGRSKQDKDNDKNSRGFVGMIAETLGMMPSEEKEDKTAAPAADANANANAGATAY